MRHNKKFNHLGRKTAHRKAMLQNMASSLIQHKRIQTTLAKAKALRMYIEPLVTKAKANSTHARRLVFSELQNKEAVSELFGPVREKVAERPGGYVRVIRTGFRHGDGAEMAMIEFVDFNEIYNPNGESGKKAAGKKRTRRGRSGSGSGSGQEKAAAAATAVAATSSKAKSEEEE